MRPDYVPILRERFASVVPPLPRFMIDYLAQQADVVLSEHAYYDWVPKTEANAVLVRANEAERDRDRAYAVVGRLLAVLESAGILFAPDVISDRCFSDTVSEWIESGRAEVARFWDGSPPGPDDRPQVIPAPSPPPGWPIPRPRRPPIRRVADGRHECSWS